MMKKERQAHILHQVNLHNRVLSADLCQTMQVSEDTIRRDLLELADLGKVVKIHGGALSVSFNASLLPTRVYSHDEKKTIAGKAISLMRDGMFILTTGGTTIIELARMLPPTLRATFITGSLPAALEYIRHPQIEVILIGDRLSRTSNLTVGGEAIARIRDIRADLCFLGINALDATYGITDNDWEVVQIKKAMIQSSDKVVAMAIAEKVNTVQKINVCGIDQLDVLITELSPDDPILQAYRDKNVNVL
jgi:DeoR/GlpR family transcriptional regulator of sugar metabolism